MSTLGFFYALDPVYLILMVAIMAITGLAQLLVKSTYSKYSKVPNRQGITGAEAAQVILRQAGIDDVRVERHQGFLSDHYSPKEKVVRLSPHNYSERSIAAVCIAAHEVGHAVQHAKRYAPLVMRNLAVPVASIGSNLGWILIIAGLFTKILGLGIAGLVLFGSVVLFQMVTLPVEFNASRRALELLPETGILAADELPGARNVLAAAALTYVAAAVAALAQLLYWAWRLGLFGGSRND